MENNQNKSLILLTLNTLSGAGVLTMIILILLMQLVALVAIEANCIISHYLHINVFPQKPKLKISVYDGEERRR